MLFRSGRSPLLATVMLILLRPGLSSCSPSSMRNSPGATPQLEKLKRLHYLQKVIDDSARRISESRLGTVQKLLVEGPSRKDPNELTGRTECNRMVNFPGGPNAARLVGQMVDVTITGVNSHSLRAEVLQREPEGAVPA